MLNLENFAQNYRVFSSFKDLNYDPEKVCRLFREWIDLDIEKTKSSPHTLGEISNLIDNISLAKDLGIAPVELARKILRYRMDDELDSCLAYLYSSDLDWMRSRLNIDSQSKENLQEIKDSEVPSTLMVIHHGPFRAWGAFIGAFERPFTLTFTDNGYSSEIVKHGLNAPNAKGLQFGENFIPQLAMDFMMGSGTVLLGDFSMSPRKSDRTSTLYGQKVHAPAGPVRFAQKMNSSLYAARLLRTDDCKFDLQISKIVDRDSWRGSSDEERVGELVENSFEWIRETLKLKPEAWQAWYRFKMMCIQE